MINMRLEILMNFTQIQSLHEVASMSRCTSPRLDLMAPIGTSDPIGMPWGRVGLASGMS